MNKVTLKLFETDAGSAGYIAWTPVPLVITNDSGRENATLRLTSKSLEGSITKVVFLETRDEVPSDEIDLRFASEHEKQIFVAGKFQDGQLHNGASRDGKDVIVEARWIDEPGEVADSIDLMVRVRKNANELSDKARREFLAALAKLNGINVDNSPGPGAGRGVYVTDFVEMHVGGANGNEHGDSHFLPWHRLYILDLERQLQQTNPSVTLPYWKFDEPAPNVFHAGFMGEVLEIPKDTAVPGGEQDVGDNTPLAVFSADNPLFKWQINNINGIPRVARFNPQTEPAKGVIVYREQRRIDFAVVDEDTTLLMGGDNTTGVALGRRGELFARTEGTPHGAAHSSFNGYITSVPIAPRDPLFFLLHANVDRLWAKWQFVFGRDVISENESYPYQHAGDANSWKIVNAKQWPWDGGLSIPGSVRAPGTRRENFSRSLFAANFAQNVPRIQDAIDHYGNRDSARYLGYAYDDVPFNGFSNQVPI